MNVKASSGSPLVHPQLFRTVSLSTIIQAEQQDRFLQLGELSQLVTFLASGNKRLEVVNVLTKNANILISKTADKIFVGGSPMSYLEQPQASFFSQNRVKNATVAYQNLSTNSQAVFFDTVSSAFSSNDSLPPGFKPIDIGRYGVNRMKKSLRDLDWFLRYLTYAIIAGDPNILSVNIRGLRELIDNACSSAAALVALQEMRKLALSIFSKDLKGQDIVREYFNVIVSEFEAASLTDKFRKRKSSKLQGLRLPRTYSKSGSSSQRFVMKTSLSTDEKKCVIKASYRQVFQRDISKAYGLRCLDLESQVKNGSLSIKEFVRYLGKSSIYSKQFFQPFTNSRVVELSFRSFLGRGVSSLDEFQKYFAILSSRGLSSLIDAIVNSTEYADYFGEETVPYLRSLGEEPQEACNWGAQIDLFKYSTLFKKTPQFITLFSDYNKALPDQHPYGSGNDPSLIQFGAIFTQSRLKLHKKPCPFGKDTRRILPKIGPGIYSQISNPSLRSKPTNLLGSKVFKLKIDNMKGLGIKQVDVNIEQVVKAAYLRVFGRFIYKEELLIVERFENLFRDRQISVQQFISCLAKSSVFRSLYWNNLYICKAIEYIHVRLIGRPTYGRKEIDKYFNIAYKQGYYRMIDAIVNSYEYIECFGEYIVPYERYVTSAELASRNFRSISAQHLGSVLNKDKLVELSPMQKNVNSNDVKKKIRQGVTQRRDQSVVFTANPSYSTSDMFRVMKAAYRQIFERDLVSLISGNEFSNLEKTFVDKRITVQQLIAKLGFSSLYRKEFYEPYPNTRVIELGTKHFLGRAPNNQAEIRYYNQILASQGLQYFVNILVNSNEYITLFGPNTVPYRRFPTLPAANFSNTEKLYNILTKQNEIVVVPSFNTSIGNQ